MRSKEQFTSHCYFASQSTDKPESSPLLAFEPQDEGVVLRFQAEAGLYQFSVVADATEFDWEDLYVELNDFGNTGQRTGPWDFRPVMEKPVPKPEGGKAKTVVYQLQDLTPVVPSYWVYLDGHRIGLWFFSRVSLDDLTGKRFRGRMACWLQQSGEHELKFVPYRPMKLRWISARLEEDPEDTLLSEAEVQQYASSRPFVKRWSDEAFWEQKRQQLQTTHTLYQKPLRFTFDYVTTAEDPGPNTWIALVAAHRLEKRPGALEALQRDIDTYLAMPHWGNPREDGYSHDGDMHVAFPLRAFAWAYQVVGDELGEERRARMRDKLVLHGERFLELMLLNRDYWGGSLRQDHGWRSTHTFCYAVLSLLDVLPQASRWLRYILPRTHRSLQVIPRDGMVPESSHFSLVLYVDDVSDLRDALLAWNGEDIYDKYPFPAIVDYVSTAYYGAPLVRMIGGNGFFNQVASKYGDGRAAWIQQRLLETPEGKWDTLSRRQGYYSDIVRGFLTYDPNVAAQEPAVPDSLQVFPDSGFVQFSDATNDIVFTTECGPWLGYHAYPIATNPCDRMVMSVGAGHFILRRGATQLLTSAASGYALHTFTKSCLLIDNKGQYGDIGYPMSIPSMPHRGHAIESTRWDEATQTGIVRLHLTPAYPEEAGLAHYTREFLFAPRQLTVRDHVVLSKPKPLSWLFQGNRRTGIALESNDGALQTGLGQHGFVDIPQARFGGENGVTLQAQPGSIQLCAAIHETPVVFSYNGGTRCYDHVRFDTAQPVDDVMVDFVIRW
jgi:hypothetical protein